MWRVGGAAGVLLVLWCVLIARLGQLHLGDNSALLQKIERLRTHRQDLRVGRGRILDCNGHLLALDLTLHNVVVAPDVVARSNAAESVSASLAQVLGKPRDQVRQRVGREQRKYEVIEPKVHDKTVEQIRAMKLPGVWFEPVRTRHYPQQELACHVVGFVNFEGVGSAGIEQSWDNILKGRPGMLVGQKDGTRREVPSRRRLTMAPREGASIYLTIDQNIQYFTERALDQGMEEFGAEAAWAAVQDVRTGAILAMASRPTIRTSSISARTSNA